MLLQAGERRARLENWFENDLLVWLGQRILPVTKPVAERWGALDGECRLRGVSLATSDGMIAATALHHNLILVTRNEKDFVGLGVTIKNPWTARSRIQSNV